MTKKPIRINHLSNIESGNKITKCTCGLNAFIVLSRYSLFYLPLQHSIPALCKNSIQLIQFNIVPSLSSSVWITLVLVIHHWRLLQVVWLNGSSLWFVKRWLSVFMRPGQEHRSHIEELDEIKQNQLTFVGHQPHSARIRPRVMTEGRGGSENFTQRLNSDTNRQLRRTHVADKGNQSCPLHHLTSNKITSINNLSYEWLDFVCF